MENVDKYETAIAEEVMAWALHHFYYEKDEQRWKDNPELVMNEHWETRAQIENDLATRGAVHGDCDAFAMMCWFSLRKAQVPSRLVMCLVETGEGHLVCMTKSGWVLDNRQMDIASNKDLERMGYKFLSMSGFEPGEAWHLVDISGR